MWGMPEVLPQDEGPGVASAINCPVLASTVLGHQHCRHVDPRVGKLYICSGGDRILHEMDRSKATHQHKLCLNQKILLTKHHLLLWCTQTHNDL
jgi:hypothetical protein